MNTKKDNSIETEMYNKFLEITSWSDFDREDYDYYLNCFFAITTRCISGYVPRCERYYTFGAFREVCMSHFMDDIATGKITKKQADNKAFDMVNAIFESVDSVSAYS